MQPPSRAAGVLGGDEREHVRRDHPPWRLADHGEEHLQVISDRGDRVRPRPHRQELHARLGLAPPRVGDAVADEDNPVAALEDHDVPLVLNADWQTRRLPPTIALTTAPPRPGSR
jgi:hypothetical protein